jgi:hypothetical protein
MPRPHSLAFSARPGCHYLFALSVTLLLFDLYFGAQVYYRWHTTSGLSFAFCSGDRILNEETAGHHALCLHAAMIYNLLLIPILAAIYAPFFGAAIYVGRRWRIQQNLAGIAYWLVAWTLVGLSPLVIVASASVILYIVSPASDQRPVAETTFLALGLLGATHGAASGVVYCILAFWRRGGRLTSVLRPLRLHRHPPGAAAIRMSCP